MIRCLIDYTGGIGYERVGVVIATVAVPLFGLYAIGNWYIRTAAAAVKFATGQEGPP